MKLRFLIFFLTVLSCSEITNPEYYEDWKSSRKNALYAEDGFLNLAGLYQIADGKHSMGSAKGNDMLMPNVFPDNFAKFTVKDSIIKFEYSVPVLFENKLITWSSSLASVGMAVALPPLLLISLQSSSKAAAFRSLLATKT